MEKINKAKTPVFLHYPKCGGMSIREKIEAVFFESGNKNKKSILYIYDFSQNNLFHLFVENFDGSNLNNTFRHPQYGWYMPLDELPIALKWQTELKIHSIVVTSHGVRFFGNNFLQIILSNYTTIDPLYFMSIRDPWEREKSFFFYLRSSGSEHELTHRYYGDISFEDYVNKDMPDSWLATTLLEKNSVDLTDNDITTILDITKKIKFFDVDNIDQSFVSIYRDCGIHLDKDFTENKFPKKYNTGVITREKIDLNSNTQIFSIFKQKKDIEYKLYEILKYRNLETDKLNF